MPDRSDVRIGELAAWLYRPAAPAGDGPVPCVVMAHGFSLTRHDGLAAYAEAFAAAGFAALVFDHRHLGDSGGEPRQRLRIAEQLADWRSALGWARRADGLDPERMVLWGFSFSGGHVTALAAGDRGIAAVVALCPFVDGLPRVLATPPSTLARLLPRALVDLAGRPTLVPVTLPVGGLAAMALEGEHEGFASVTGPASPWRNAIAPGVLATVALHRPVRRAGRIACPVWVGLGERDVSVAGPAVRRLAERAPRGELHAYDVDHFAPFRPPWSTTIAEDQVAFLRRVL